ncbi:MAG TPA: tRNA pseudouridine(38-40) synthase TruA [Candidatus Limnocylindrales bacterium]|nr:tRNA pseudouridine(38-40) synthase TruA [Candidatus Limnocylindrales bacterium]
MPAREGGLVRYRARVEYDGTDFAGFQVQPGRRTVQGELEAALARIAGGGRVRVVAAGRTDAGVHASGQVIAFTWPTDLPAARLARALDALLPADVAVRGLRWVGAAWQPRYAARYREYRYTVWNGPRSPLRERTALGVRVPLDVSAMAEAAQVLVGRHDFSAFGAAHRQPIRTVEAIRIRRQGRTITIDVRGQAFLRQMVRSLVAALLRVGRGEATAADLSAALAARERAFSGAVAPAHGLCLRRVALGRPVRTRNGAC